MNLYKIGRSASCDIVLDHHSVSRNHAELLVLGDGRLYLTDCASKNGTYILQDARQQTVRQTFVQPADCLRFGDKRPTVADLLGRITPGRHSKNGASASEDDENSLPKGQVMRDPRTGEIIPA